jgi:hypothetical protein
VTPDERFSLTLTAIGLLFVMMSAGLGLIVRITAKWTRVEDRLDVLVTKISEVVTGARDDKGQMHEQIDRVDRRIERHEEWHDTH